MPVVQVYTRIIRITPIICIGYASNASIYSHYSNYLYYLNYAISTSQILTITRIGLNYASRILGLCE